MPTNTLPDILLNTEKTPANITSKTAEKIVVGLSGGVDSSVAAALLHRAGYDVTGLTLWLMRGKGQCCSEKHY